MFLCMFISREIVKNVQVDNQYYSRYCMKFRLRRDQMLLKNHLGYSYLFHLEGKLLLLVTFDVTYIQSFLFFEKVFSPFKKLIQFFSSCCLYFKELFFYTFKSIKSHWLYYK